MKKIILILFLVLFVSKPTIADDAYPMSYSIDEVLTNGKILRTDSGYSFVLKKVFGEAEYVLNIVKPGINKSVQIVQLSNLQVLNSAIFDSGLLLITLADSGYCAEIFDTKGIRNSKLVFPDLQIGNSIQFKIIDTKDSSILILADRELYELFLHSGEIVISKIADEVLDSKYISEDFELVFISNNQSGSYLNLINNNGKIEIISKLSACEKVRMWTFGDTIIVGSGSEFAKSTLIQTITLNGGIVAETWIDANLQHLQILNGPGEIFAIFLKNSGTYYLQKKYLIKGNLGFSLPIIDNLIEPYSLHEHNGKIYCLFRNGLTVFSVDGKALSLDLISIGEYFRDEAEISFQGKQVLLHSADVTLELKATDNGFWLWYKYYQQVGKLLIPILLSLALLLVFQLYRHQKRMLDLLQEQATQGVIYFIDKSGKLMRANESGKELLNITASVPKRKNFEYYCINPNLTELKDFVLNAIAVRDSINQKILVSGESDTKEWIFNVMPMRNIAGRFRGLVITGIDISEELEKKRLSNWASLAHDMQTNLSTIRLNAEQMSIENEDENYLRRTKIIHQVNVLIHRVRDIVTVGRTNHLDKQFYDSADICREVISEFDSSLFPHVVFQVESSSIKVLCDKPKMIRAIRNAVENGIRALKGNSGKIIISNSSDYRNVYFTVRDSGIGMDQKTKQKMLTPYFTTGSKEGGFGIGTMIMQHVVELHGGEIIINSETNKGTELIFSIPNISATLNKKKNSNKLFVRKKVT